MQAECLDVLAVVVGVEEGGDEAEELVLAVGEVGEVHEGGDEVQEGALAGAAEQGADVVLGGLVGLEDLLEARAEDLEDELVAQQRLQGGGDDALDQHLQAHEEHHLRLRGVRLLEAQEVEVLDDVAQRVLRADAVPRDPPCGDEALQRVQGAQGDVRGQRLRADQLEERGAEKGSVEPIRARQTHPPHRCELLAQPFGFNVRHPRREERPIKRIIL